MSLLVSCCCHYCHERGAVLQGGEAGLAAALLQALRWRLDKATAASDRCQVLASYIENDTLLLRQVKPQCTTLAEHAPLFLAP